MPREPWGHCDLCGFPCLIAEMRHVYVRRHKQNSLRCPECWDPDHPGNFVGENPPVERAPLVTRPNPTVDSDYGFPPVGFKTSSEFKGWVQPQ